MKKIIVAAAFLMGAFMFSCQDDINMSEISNLPPTVLKTTPDGVTKVGNDFNVSVVFVDGPTSPLASATVTLTDSLGAVLHTETKTLSGTKDSVVLTADKFNAKTLPLGLYNIVIKAVDTKGNETDKTIPFHVSVNLFAAKNKAMYLAGVFNGWGALEMTLVGPYTWQAKHVDFNKGEFKFKNTPDWSDKDWGDPECDGLMASPAGNTTCAYSGLSTVTFNDNTLTYTVSAEVSYKHTLPALYFQSSKNSYDGSAMALSLTADNMWSIQNLRLKPGDLFQLGTAPRGGAVYGGVTGTSGKVTLDGARMQLGATDKDGFYNLTLNDKTMQYTITLDHLPTMFLVGAATPGGWTSGNALPFKSTGEGTFEIYAYLNAGEFKYIPSQAGFDGDWGPVKGSGAAASGTLTQDGEDNASVATSGFYRITLDLNAKTYSVTKTDWAVVGAATPGGWPSDPPAVQSDTQLTYTSGTKWEGDVVMTAGEFKYRANKSWGLNLGGDGAGFLKNDGSNLSIATPGLYHIVLNLDPVNGYTSTATLK